MSTEAKIFFSGVPTKPDVEKLRDALKIPEEGVLIPWERFESVLGFKRTTHRFSTVLQAWRRGLESEHQIIMGAVSGKGLMRLAPNDRIEHGAAKTRRGVRQIGRGARIVLFTDRSRLTPENQKAADHLTRCATAMKLAMATAAKEISLPSLEVK